MRNVIIILIVIILAGGIWYVATRGKNKPPEATAKAMAVSQHSDLFNNNMNAMLTQYAAMTEGFINWDTVAIDQHAASLLQRLQSIPFNELKDSAVYQTATSYQQQFNKEVTAIEKGGDIAKKRLAYNSFSQHLYDMLRAVHYDRSPIYLQECPMAYESEPGMWVSREEAIRNPYMGLHHPKYGKAMMDCGDIKDSLNYTTAATP